MPKRVIFYFMRYEIFTSHDQLGLRLQITLDPSSFKVFCLEVYVPFLNLV